ncbi:MAG: dethiobiotin synthase [Rhodocyclaceae bacterium]|nr:MAG: dethiobiotin synthase [Rhodocyclaceae bacterium]
MGANFITGTGTDIGKTWLACALLRHWRAAGLAPAAFKPVLSGFDALHPGLSDAGALLLALGREPSAADLDAIAPWRFAAPLSPDMAATREGRRIDFAALVDFSRRIIAAPDRPLLIEGVGGVMAPLDERHTVRDWIAASGLPCVLVAGSYLGSLSHTLTALEALQKVMRSGIPGDGAGVTAIVVNETPGSTVALDATLETLSRFVAGIPLVAIARSNPPAGVARLAELLC